MKSSRPGARPPQHADADPVEAGPAVDVAIARVHARFRLVLGAFTLAMLGLSWPLWVDPSGFPRVPFVPALPQLRGVPAWIIFGMLLGDIAAAGLGIAWRALFGLSVVWAGLLVAADQHRFQPWLYQYMLLAWALATTPERRALGLARLLMIAIYVHSGLSKLDVSFCNELGESFLEALVRPFHLEPQHWPTALRYALILAMPAAELAIAAGLAFQWTRRYALACAIALHVVLLWILGPFGLRHSTIVLVWNAAFIAEDVLLFGSRSLDTALPAHSAAEPRLSPITAAVFALAVLMPFGERAGLWDTWPSFALYASHAERTTVLVQAADAAILPPAAARQARAVPGTSWLELDLTGWSREVRGVPVYPQARACLGVAEALARIPGLEHSVGVVVWSRAGWLTGRRTSTECWGLEAIHRQGDRYHLNARPARGWHANEPGAARAE